MNYDEARIIVLEYLKSVIEGAEDIEPWLEWIGPNESALTEMLGRVGFLRLKHERINAIPEVLDRFEIEFEQSDRYAWLGGIPGHCRDCGAEVKTRGALTWCTKGCFRLHVLRKPQGRS